MLQERNNQYAQILSKMIRHETISVLGEKNPSKFEAFHQLLKELFPKLFEVVAAESYEGSLLLRWQGKDAEKQPILLMSHHDVVEAAGPWSHEPFSGEISDGKLWGRGTLDTKGSLWAMLQAGEELAAEGFVPECDIYYESACTEETSGEGADMISRELEARGIKFRMTLDEGGMIMYDPIGGADGTFAMIGVGEKGCADLKFIAKSGGGHAATPGKDTPLVRLGKFMAEAEKGKCFTAKMSPVTLEMLRRVGKVTKGPLGFLFRNAVIFKPLLCKLMPAVSGAAGAMLKTTLAFTMAKGSEGTNVLPQEAYVIGNMRFSHHQGQKNSFDKIIRLAKKYDIDVEIPDAGFESPLSDYRSKGFKLIEEATAEVFPGVIPVPYVMTGASDSRYFGRVSDCCLRFAPFLIDEQQLDSIHGIDENVDISTLAGAVDFYKYIIRRA